VICCSGDWYTSGINQSSSKNRRSKQWVDNIFLCSPSWIAFRLTVQITHRVTKIFTKSSVFGWDNCQTSCLVANTSNSSYSALGLSTCLTLTGARPKNPLHSVRLLFFRSSPEVYTLEGTTTQSTAASHFHFRATCLLHRHGGNGEEAAGARALPRRVRGQRPPPQK
jgi:hypothetical protein